MVDRVHVALDEIAGTSVDSEFLSNFDNEVVHALLTASTELSEELPDVYLLPKTVGNQEFEVEETEGGAVTFTRHVKNADGTGSLRLPLDFLRLVRLHMVTWRQDVRSLTDAASNDGRMQASSWTRGTPQKPRAMLGASATDSAGNVYRALDYYTVGKTNDAYDHDVESLVYVPYPRLADGSLVAGLTDRAIPLIVYRACAILMEGKMNSGLADRFRAMSAVQ